MSDPWDEKVLPRNTEEVLEMQPSDVKNERTDIPLLKTDVSEIERDPPD